MIDDESMRIDLAFDVEKLGGVIDDPELKAKLDQARAQGVRCKSKAASVDNSLKFTALEKAPRATWTQFETLLRNTIILQKKNVQEFLTPGIAMLTMQVTEKNKQTKKKTNKNKNKNNRIVDWKFLHRTECSTQCRIHRFQNLTTFFLPTL